MEEEKVTQRRVPQYEVIQREAGGMSGWKTKVGAVITAIGGTIIGSAEIAPTPGMIPWLKFIGFIISGIGGALTIWGIGHKLEKTRNMKKVPFLIKEL